MLEYNLCDNDISCLSIFAMRIHTTVLTCLCSYESLMVFHKLYDDWLEFFAEHVVKKFMTHIVFLFKFEFIGVNPIRMSIIYTFTYRHASKVHKFFLDAWFSDMRDEIEIIDVCCHAKEKTKRKT